MSAAKNMLQCWDAPSSPKLWSVRASPPPLPLVILWWSAQTKGPTMCLLWCVQCQAGEGVTASLWSVALTINRPRYWIFWVLCTFALLFALNVRLSPWVLLTWCSGQILLGWWWPVPHCKRRFSSVAPTGQFGTGWWLSAFGTTLVHVPFFSLPVLLPLEAAGILSLTRNQLLFFNQIIGKLVWDNNSSLGTFNKSTGAKTDRFGYLFLSRIEQKLPLEPLESLPFHFLSFLPPTPFTKVQLKLTKNVYFLNGKCLAGLGTIYKTGVWLRQLPTPCLGLIVPL